MDYINEVHKECIVPSEYLGEGKTISDSMLYFTKKNLFVEIHRNRDSKYYFDFYTPRGEIKAHFRWAIPNNSFDTPTKAYLGALKFWFNIDNKS